MLCRNKVTFEWLSSSSDPAHNTSVTLVYNCWRWWTYNFTCCWHEAGRVLLDMFNLLPEWKHVCCVWSKHSLQFGLETGDRFAATVESTEFQLLQQLFDSIDFVLRSISSVCGLCLWIHGVFNNTLPCCVFDNSYCLLLSELKESWNKKRYKQTNGAHQPQH